MLIRSYIGMSVDGFVATPDGVPAWGERFDLRNYGYDEFVSRIGVIVMGRIAFERTLEFEAWPWPGMTVHVLTSRPLPMNAPAGVTAWHAGPTALLAHLLAANLSGDVWVFGGPKTVRTFRELGAIDQLELYLLPVMLGDGIPLFVNGGMPQSLRLERHRVFPDSTVGLVYSLNERSMKP